MVLSFAAHQGVGIRVVGIDCPLHLFEALAGGRDLLVQMREQRVHMALFLSALLIKALFVGAGVRLCCHRCVLLSPQVRSGCAPNKANDPGAGSIPCRGAGRVQSALKKFT